MAQSVADEFSGICQNDTFPDNLSTKKQTTVQRFMGNDQINRSDLNHPAMID